MNRCLAICDFILQINNRIGRFTSQHFFSFFVLHDVSHHFTFENIFTLTHQSNFNFKFHQLDHSTSFRRIDLDCKCLTDSQTDVFVFVLKSSVPVIQTDLKRSVCVFWVSEEQQIDAFYSSEVIVNEICIDLCLWTAASLWLSLHVRACLTDSDVLHIDTKHRLIGNNNICTKVNGFAVFKC